MYIEDIKLTVFILFVGLFVILFLANIQVIRAEEDYSVLFTEIMYDVDGGDDGFEWVEIYNNGRMGLTIDSNWRFYDGSNHVLNIIQGDDQFASGEAIVIADDTDKFLLSYPDYVGTLLDSVVKLNNIGEQIMLSIDGGETWLTDGEYLSEWGGSGDGYSLEYRDAVWQSSINVGGSPGEYIADVADEQECPTLEDLSDDDGVGLSDDVVEEDDGGDDEIINNEIINDEDLDIEEINNDVGENDEDGLDKLVVYSNLVRINELLPDPDGSDEEGEYIEIYNGDNIDIDLTNWRLEDNSSSKYILSGNINIGEYIVINRGESKITLNNSSGDRIKLYNPNNDLVSEVNYDKSVPGSSYSYFDADGWKWTNLLTPGEINNIDTDDEDVAEEEQVEEAEERVYDDKSNDDNEAAIKQLQLISDIKDISLNSEVYIQGIVTALPGQFSETYFYVSEIYYDGIINLNVGIQIYYSKKDFPELSIGSVINVFGKLSETRSERRIKISSREDIEIVKLLSLPTADEVATGDINDDLEGGLVTVIGDLVDKQSISWYVDDDSGEIRVYMNSKTGITKPSLDLGQEVMITAIVSETKSGFRLLPRFDEDINVEQIVTENEAPEVSVISGGEKREINVIENNEARSGDYLGYGLGVVGLTMISWVVRLKFF